MESSAAAAIEAVFVQASGRKSRPSCDSRVNTGRKETVIRSSEKKSDGPTSRHDSPTTCQCGLPGSRRARCRCAFSTITMPASTIVPMATATPPSDMTSSWMPSRWVTRQASRNPTGSERIATAALPAWSRKIRQTTPITANC